MHCPVMIAAHAFDIGLAQVIYEQMKQSAGEGAGAKEAPAAAAPAPQPEEKKR